MANRTNELIEMGNSGIISQIEKKLRNVEENVQKYYVRMNQLEIKSSNTLLDVQNQNNRFTKKVEEVTDRWMTALGKEEKVRVQLKAFNE